MSTPLTHELIARSGHYRDMDISGVERDTLLLDPRTVDPSDDGVVAKAIKVALSA